ncbi:MAG: hypothetical protein Q8O93_03060 [bacterium]|nr:hypothetical protein [bacterium]
MTKQFKIALVVLLVAFIALVAGNYYLQSWTDFKMAKVGQGLAESRYPWRDYTAEELNKMYPQIRYADVPTRVAPEQTYANFRQALKDNNLELAIEQLSKSSRERYNENKDSLTVLFKENKFAELYNYYPEKIEKASMSETLAQYEFNYYSSEYKRELIGSLGFTKNANGDWKMDSL